MSRRSLFILAALVLLFIAMSSVLWRGYQRGAAPENNPNLGIRSAAAVFPTGVAVDNEGNVYVTAQRQHRVLKVSPARGVTIAAGNGGAEFGGDGGPADQAGLDSPMSISLDPSGNLFIVDTGNNRIRRVDAKTHVITTVAGNGVLGGLVDKGATATGLYQPVSVAVDGNENLYIGGSHFVSVARVDAITRIITKVVGAGLPGDPMAEVPAPGPFWLAVDERGSIWFSDPNQSTVSRVKVDESPHTFAGGAVCGFGGDGGPANGALLCFPEGLSVRNQELYIADTGNNRIRKVDLRTGIITTVAGTGEPGYAGDGGPAVNANLNGPMGVTVDGLGNLYIADTGNNCIRRLDAQTGVVTTWVTARQLDRSVLRRA